jgi:hypothetical protein
MELMKSIQGARHIGDLLRDKYIVQKGADVLSQRRFTQVPNHLLRSDKESPGATLTYTMLLSYACHNEFCFRRQERLAKGISASMRSAMHRIQRIAPRRPNARTKKNENLRRGRWK